MKSSYSKIKHIYNISSTSSLNPDDVCTKIDPASYCQNGVCHGHIEIPCGSQPTPPTPTDTYYFCDSGKNCKQSGENDPKTYKNDSTCANSCNTTPVLCPVFNPNSGNWCKTDTKNPICQDSGPSGIPIPCCTNNDQCISNSCDLITHKCKGWCLDDKDCNPHNDPTNSLVCNTKNNSCVSKDPSVLGKQIAASIKPSDSQINSIIANLNIPKPLLKSKPRSGRPFRMTLWHEGVVGIDSVENLKNYFSEMIQFIKDKQFDRVFFQLGDPYLTDSYGNRKFLYADPKFVINNMIAPLSELPDVEIGALLDVDPSTIWTYNLSLPGGIYGNNPGYTNKSDCSSPFRQCDINNPNLYCAENQSSTDHGGIVSKTGCISTPDKYNGTPFCLNYPPGCPNNLEQGMQYIGDINKIAKSKGLRPITTVAFDGEDFAHYGADKYGMAQAWQASKQFAPDVNEIGYAKGPGTNPADNMTNAAYPELYWIGELKPTDNGIGVGCSGCKANDDNNNKQPGCMNCVKAIYQQFKNDPQGMLNAFKPLLNAQRKNVSSPGCCPLFSIEHYHFGPSNPNDCIQLDYYSSGFCGTFDGFGNWDWDKFEQFMILYSNEFNAKEIGVYEWQFVPKQWRTSSPPINLCKDVVCDINKKCNSNSGKCVCINGSLNDNCSLSCPNNCSGHGKCDSNSGKCNCDAGWSGESCSNGGKPQPTNPCDGVNCGSHGTCDSTTGKCNCDAGWSGESCSNGGKPQPTNPCDGVNCGSHGTCDSTTGKCNCDVGWSGESCNIFPTIICPNNCSGHGKCDSTGKCNCDAGWSGESCSNGGTPQPTNPCDGVNCGLNKICKNGSCQQQNNTAYDYSWLIYIGIIVFILIIFLCLYFTLKNKK